jgi:hypothetical protein
MTRLRTALTFLVILVACSGGNAASITFIASLTTSKEVPPTTNNLTNSSTGQPRPVPFGTATFLLDFTNPNAPFMTFSATIFNIDVTGSQTPNDTNDNLVNAHIHAAPGVGPGVNAPVVWGFFGSPYNDTNPDDSINSTTPPLHVIPFTSGVGGTFGGKWDASEGNGTTLIEQLPNLMAGSAYINFHTVQNSGGEIRGFFQAVPEPTSIVMLSMGVLGVFAYVWRTQGRMRR